LVLAQGPSFSREKKAIEHGPTQGLVPSTDFKFPVVTQLDRGRRLVFKNVCLFVSRLQKKNFFFSIIVGSKNLLSPQLGTKTIMEALQTNVQNRKRDPTDY